MNANSQRGQYFTPLNSNESTVKTINSRKKFAARFKPNALILAMSISGLLFGYEGSAMAELTATSSEPTPATDQGSLASGFNAAVTEARILNFTQTNYTALYDANQQSWQNNKLADNVTYACPNPNTNPALPPGYFAGLWNRCAYYSRDYVHQATGAYYLGYYEQNYTMADKFASQSHVNGGVNAPYWAISVMGLPYEQGDELPAPFELGENIANMYRLTADTRYFGQNFTNYISQMTSYVNAKSNVNGVDGDSFNADGFRMARTQNGETASYNEFLPDGMKLLLGGDTAASQIAYYRAISKYPSLATQNSTSKYNTLLQNFNSNWYSTTANHFYVGLVGNPGTSYSSNSTPNYSNLTYDNQYIREPNIFPLYKGVITDSTKLQNQANYIDSNEETTYNNANKYLGSPGIEYHTYLPSAFYNAKMPDKAWKWLTRLAKWQINGGNNTYPEVAFAMISDTITKVLGVDYDAPNSVLSTLSGLPSSFAAGNYVTVSNIPIYNKAKSTTINVNITQKINSSGANQTDIAFVTDLSTVAFNQGFHWAPKFSNPSGMQYCKLTTTFTDGTSQVSYPSVMTDTATNISTCQDGTNIGIWVYTGTGARVSSYSATLSATNS
ncbi:hypothetical protein [Burkholderia sp. RF4-BP95]|uniref:hypothetical protein n=1 Tax=Burkholderia sp. RF4-BP95 TaxID=1637845 RepID=UPI0009E8588B|nr:hypothetical protein [Burkholderia sp. RF4-BP95]